MMQYILCAAQGVCSTGDRITLQREVEIRHGAVIPYTTIIPLSHT